MMKQLSKKLVKKPQSINWQGLLSVLLLVALVVPVIMVSPTSDVAPRAQPILLELAAERPEDRVTVIVQKLGQDASADDLVARLGGVVTKDLRIINAIAAELPAKAVPELARAAGVRWVSLDGQVVSAGRGGPKGGGNDSGGGGGGGSSDPPPESYYLDTLNVRQVWDMGLRGEGIAVAVIDSGVTKDPDITRRVSRQMSFNPNSSTVNDVYGHGTYVAGIIAGEGSSSSGTYMGVAPGSNVISLKISDETGMAYESDTVEAMQWVLDNKSGFNIRVVNLSINSTVEQSYHTSPLDAAAEILWFNGIVVVVSSGNKSPDNGYNPVLAPPANDPFVITVGATDEKGSSRRNNDGIASFSAYDESTDGFLKPEIHAPGVNIISLLASSSNWDVEYPERVVLGGIYFRLSGTSASAPMVAGAVALLLQDEPNLTPDQVKYRLLNTAGSVGKGRYLDVYAAVTGTTTESANTGLEASQLLWTGNEPVMWDSVNWNSVNWNSVNWNSVNWNSVNWNSVNWNSVNWND